MKNFFLLVLSLFATTTFAQATFEMSSDTASVYVDLDLFDVEVHNEMTNLTSTDRFIKWERTVISIEPDTLYTRICDPDACFAEWVDTHTFLLTADTTIPMIVHLYKQIGQDASAIVQLRFTDQTTPGDAQFSYYIFNSAASLSTDDKLPAANVKLYPNPVVESFSLDNAEEVARIRVFSTDGRQVAAFEPSFGQTYSLATQPAGAYVVALESKSGKIFQAIAIRKD